MNIFGPWTFLWDLYCINLILQLRSIHETKISATSKAGNICGEKDKQEPNFLSCVLCIIYYCILQTETHRKILFIFILKAVSSILVPYRAMVNPAVLHSWIKWRGSPSTSHYFWKWHFKNLITVGKCSVKYHIYPDTVGQSNKMQERFHLNTHICSYILGWNKWSAKVGCKRHLRHLYYPPKMLEPQFAEPATSICRNPSCGNYII